MSNDEISSLGGCRWNCIETGRQVRLTDTNLLMISEVERRVLQKVALAKLQALNLGASVRVPTGEDSTVAAKPRRRPYLLRRKARTTTSPLDGGRGKDVNSGSGLVFGIPISQCIENEATANRSGRDSGGSSSRSSAGSLSESTTISPPSPRRDSSDERPRESVEWRWSDGWPEESAPPNPRVPQVVLQCLSHIREYGLHTLGIFRVGSSKKRVRQLREDLDMGKETDLSASQCPHDVAALLKEYFRDLPEPLLCRELYTAFVRTQGIRNRRLQFEALQHLVQLLPPAHRDTLCLLLDFLAVVAKHAEDKRDPHSGEWLSGNKMDSGNLATLFAPNILRRTTGDLSCDSRDEAAEDRLDVINVVSAELLDEVYVHMMDTHPDALDDLLRSRCPPQTEETWDDHLISDGVEQQQGEVQGTPPRRRVWSREEFLHGTAGMGGPDLAMMPRHRSREGKGSKKRTKEPQPDSISRGKSSSEERPRGGSVTDIRTVRMGGERNEDATGSRRATDDEDSADGERGVITASLRIPVPAHVALEDIPFIEDGVSEVGRAPPPRPSTSLPPSPVASSASLTLLADRQPLMQPPPSPTLLSVPLMPPLASSSTEGRSSAPEREAAQISVSAAEIASLEREAQSERKLSAEEAMAEATKRGAIRSMTTVDMSRRQRSSTRAEAAETDKRYARRRYTDGRHAAAALPEVASPKGPVWKRREIIASEPRRRAAQ
ncbi:hypothetical protein J437_LFUL002246 [Ladona fulva]|uniref:Rho-GAP domain-containing protein n=1 Tax=Ladona fulva TaxID=123851 RepID=A0A8K0JYW1_LADFU|nr:hypothetical protein J437_LFUL002246 [Ladona fulva]